MPDDRNVNKHGNHARREDTPGVRRRVLTLDRIKSQALTRLGYPTIDIEVDPVQLGEFWETTLDEYNKWLPLQKFDMIESTSGTRSRYNLDDMNKPYGRGITSVSIVSRDDFFSPISGVFALGIPHPISHLAPDQYDLALRYIKQAKHVYSSEPDWEWEEPMLWLYAPTGFGGPFAAAYEYSQDVMNPEDVPQEDWKWVMDYFHALTQEAVGLARRKFGTIPGPDSQSLDGDTMVSQALERQRQLEEQIETKSYARVPPIGPGGF